MIGADDLLRHALPQFFEKDTAGLGEQAVFLPDDDGTEGQGWL